MPRELFERSARGARLASIAAVALAAGVVVGVSTLGPGVDEIRTVAGGSSASAGDSSPGQGHGHGQADKTDKAKTDEAKPDKVKHDQREHAENKSADAEKAGGVHGHCVSAVARDKQAVGGPHDNHGWAVSRAAHTCPRPTPVPSGGS